MTEEEYEAACKRTNELASKYPRWDDEWTVEDDVEYAELTWKMLVYVEKMGDNNVQND